MATAGSFEFLSPQDVVRAVEQAYGCLLDGTLDPYSSYVNRVYGVRREDGGRLVAKFYRPGRWSEEAVLDEHRFLLDCAAAEIPVVAPLPGTDGRTLHEVEAGSEEGNGSRRRFLFAVFPRMGGRTFEPESDADYVRLGSLLGRVHAVAAAGQAPHRLQCDPGTLTAAYVEEIVAADLVHPDVRGELREVCAGTIERIAPLFSGVQPMRIHGDCHRANIIDRGGRPLADSTGPGEGLALIDFDDMMRGPAVQDLWLILPGSAAESRRELECLLEGYEQFHRLDRRSLSLIEPLRFMRMIYFLAWQARQREDYSFHRSFPDWGTKAFWIKEVEDLRTQQARIAHELEQA